MDHIESSVAESKNIISQIVEKKEKVDLICSSVLETLKSGNKIMICGNGGSASQSQHFAAELVGRYQRERKGYYAVALTTDTSIITSVSNDYSFDDVFSRQVESIGRIGDLLIGLSTSGESRNVLRAFEVAKQKGIKTIGILGRKGSIYRLSDIYIDFDGPTPRVQEAHLLLIHIICSFIDNNL